MRDELTRELLAAGPTIFKTTPTFYFECEDGWFDLLKDLIALLESVMTDSEQPLIVAQVKEKFGGLRFYVYNSNDVCDGYIDWAERRSWKTCCRCGTPGTMKTNNGWSSVLCEICAAPVASVVSPKD